MSFGSLKNRQGCTLYRVDPELLKHETAKINIKEWLKSKYF